jgi:lipoprotein-releasing system ATP-binding protein
MSSVLELSGVSRRYGPLVIFEDIDFDLAAGGAAALLGSSGSGKSSLLHMAGLLEQPSSGKVLIGGRDSGKLNDRARTVLRRDAIGFVYQFHHLLAEFTALRNVMIPGLIAGMKPADAMARATDLLNRLGLEDRLGHQPAQLSGGEKQRVAIARALINRPQLLLADEPTGNLDQETSARVFELFLELTSSEGVGLVMATHDQNLAAKLPRLLRIENKKLQEDPRP